MYNRIKLVRKKKGLSQEAFGAALGVTKSTISLLEAHKREPSERILRDICREFNINKDWLRIGAGGEDNMFVHDDTPKLKDLIIEMLTDLPDEYWDQIEVKLKNGIKKEE